MYPGQAPSEFALPASELAVLMVLDGCSKLEVVLCSRVSFERPRVFRHLAEVWGGALDFVVLGSLKVSEFLADAGKSIFIIVAKGGKLIAIGT